MATNAWFSNHVPSRGLLRLAVRLPIGLYQLGLGWLLGHRLLMLTHRGRKSGRTYRTVLEVVRADRNTGDYVVASGWGEQADWYRNILANPAVVVEVAGRRFDANAEPLGLEAAQRELCDYARRHPIGFSEISRLVAGTRLNGTPEDCERLAKAVPLVVLRPRQPGPAQQDAGVTA